MDSITLWGPIRLLPTQSTAWGQQQAERLKDFLSTPDWHATFEGVRHNDPLGDVPPAAYQYLLEMALVAGDPKSWEGGPFTLKVGGRWPVKLGHLALVDLADGRITAIRHFT